MSALGAPRANEIVSPAIASDTSNAPLPVATRTTPILATVKRGGRGPRATALAAVVVLAGALALASWRDLGEGDAAAAASRSTGASDLAALGLLLRLHDLPLGYRLSGGSPEFTLPGCGLIEPAKPQPRLAAFLDRFSPAGCSTLYARLFRVPGGEPAPLAVGTGALDAGSVEGAEAGLSVSRELLSHLLGNELPREVPPPETIGDATRLYRWDHGGLFEADEGSSSFLVWRSGSVAASIFVAGGSATANDRAAVELVHIQQGRIEAPTSYTPAEYDDTEVPLEDPALEVPIYWLGRSLAAGRGLPRLRLFDTISTTRRALSAPRASLFYVDHWSLSPAEGVYLNLWSRKQWQHLRNRRGRPPGSLRCATAQRLTIPKGRAVIYAGFERVRGACPDRPPSAHTARIYLPRVVVTAETLQICATCAEPGRGAYNSVKGMAKIARSLELRPRPPLPTASP